MDALLQVVHLVEVLRHFVSVMFSRTTRSSSRITSGVTAASFSSYRAMASSMNRSTSSSVFADCWACSLVTWTG